MEDFWSELPKPFFLFFWGLLIGFLRARRRKTPLARKEEFIRYHQYLKKPVIWSFITMFCIVLLIGVFVNDDFLEVTGRAILAGLYTCAALYVFMIWGANLIREK